MRDQIGIVLLIVCLLILVIGAYRLGQLTIECPKCPKITRADCTKTCGKNDPKCYTFDLSWANKRR